MSALRPKGQVPHPTSFSPRWAAALTRWLEELVMNMRGGNIEVGGLLITESGRRMKVTEVTTATYQALVTDEVIHVNYAGAVTITMPAGSDIGRGGRLIVQDTSGAAASNNITIQRKGSDTVNGGTSIGITGNYGRRELVRGAAADEFFSD